MSTIEPPRRRLGRRPSAFRPFEDARTDLFGYFVEQLGEADWSRWKVLDFGGNIGGLLRDPESTIREERYWAIDVVPEAIERGRCDFQRAHWLHYDRFNPRFNPSGIVDLDIPDLGERFDVILAYSVFTHTFLSEVRSLVPQLERMLEPGGRLAFTFLDPHARPHAGAVDNLRHRLTRFQDISSLEELEELAPAARRARQCLVIDGDRLIVDVDDLPDDAPSGLLRFDSLFTVELIQELFPQASIRPPVAGQRQHCCLIERPNPRRAGAPFREQDAGATRR